MTMNVADKKAPVLVEIREVHNYFGPHDGEGSWYLAVVQQPNLATRGGTRDAAALAARCYLSYFGVEHTAVVDMPPMTREEYNRPIFPR